MIVRSTGTARLTVMRLLAGLALAFVALPAGARDAAPAGDEIVVTGVRVSTLDLKRLLRARAIFVRGRAAFAPTSALLFQIRPAAGVAVAGMTLRLRDGDRTIPVAIDGDNRFSLPDLPAGRWELVHNRGAGRIAVRALVVSAGATEADRPLGDLRLQCRVGWELKKSAYSVFARGGFSAVGGCASERIAFFFETPRRIAEANATDGSSRIALPLRGDRMGYRAPLADGKLANATRIRVRFD